VINRTDVLYDLNTAELAAEYKRAVAAAIPDGTIVPAAFWTDLANAVADYVIQTDEDERPRKFILESMREIGKLIDQLGEELRLIRQVQLEPLDASIHLLSALGPARVEVELHAGRYGRMIAAHRGHNPHQQELYSAVIQLWAYTLGKRFRCAKNGPLVRFFLACVGPVLGDDAPKASGVPDIVGREKKRYLRAIRPVSESKK
jgi:hypothetical protein